MLGEHKKREDQWTLACSLLLVENEQARTLRQNYLGSSRWSMMYSLSHLSSALAVSTRQEAIRTMLKENKYPTTELVGDPFSLGVKQAVEKPVTRVEGMSPIGSSLPLKNRGFHEAPAVSASKKLQSPEERA